MNHPAGHDIWGGRRGYRSCVTLLGTWLCPLPLLRSPLPQEDAAASGHQASDEDWKVGSIFPGCMSFLGLGLTCPLSWCHRPSLHFPFSRAGAGTELLILSSPPQSHPWSPALLPGLL